MTSASPGNASARTRLAVVGSPIAHSLSPTLHGAAYRRLGLPWSYDAIELASDGLTGFLDSCDDRWRGISLTMPLKRDVIELLQWMDPVAVSTGVVNTVQFTDGERRGFNTDVAGISRSLAQNGVGRLSEVVILGGGATASSALLAAHEFGVVAAHIWVRSPARANPIRDVAHRLGIDVTVSAFADASEVAGSADAVFSTLPNGSDADLMFAESLRRNALLFDVAYDPWPTGLAAAWQSAGGTVISGLQMLVNQALVQVRVFVSGDPECELPNESEVLAAMWASVRDAGNSDQDADGARDR